jgi:hypothetical protein
MTGPLGVLAAGPAAATTEVEDVNGGPPGGCRRQIRQWSPTKLKTSMAAPWGCWRQGPAAATTEVENIDNGPPGGCWQQGPAVATTEVEDIDGGPLGVPELDIRERSAFEARPTGRAVNGCRNLGTNAQKVVRTYFTLTQVGHFC